MPRRIDAGEPLKKPTKMANGWLKVDALITRTGVFSYRQPDGSTLRELRLPEDVFNTDALESFGMVPVTDDHPPDYLDADNTKTYAAGSVSGTVTKDGDHVRTQMLLTDAALIQKVEGGQKSEVSCGYVCDLEDAPGVWNGQHYDAIQRNIRGNHVAIVDKGRAGPTVRVRLDAKDAVMIPSETHDDGATSQPGEAVKKIRIDGIEFDGSDQLEQALTVAFTKRDDAMKAAEQKAAEATGKVEKLQAKVDALSEDLKKAESARKDAEDPEKMRAVINARVALESKAKMALGSETKLDSMTDQAIKLAVLAKLHPDRKMDGKSEAYVDGAFELAAEKLDTEDAEDVLSEARLAAQGISAVDPKRVVQDATDAQVKNEKLRDERRKEESARWTKPLSFGMSRDQVTK